MTTSAFPGQALDRTVQVQPTYEELPRSTLVLELATVADDITPWGRAVSLRDRQLREFWPTEPILASALFSIVARNAAFSWTLEGPPRTVAVYQRIFHEADLGGGWLSFVTKLAIDLYTQDNGAFIEVIRSGPNADDPVVGLAHLDALACRRTGIPAWPVVYFDRHGGQHRLAAHQVIMWTEFPSPIETMNGAQFCAVSRILRAAQLLRDVSIYQREKVAGNNPSSIYLTNGVKASEISDAIAEHRNSMSAQGFARYLRPVVIASLDPTTTISVEEIAMASLPDGFSLEESMKWYINQLALAFGVDYQEFGPLPGNSLGTGAQSVVLREKSRGKGPAIWIKSLEHILNFHGVLPRNVTFRFDEQDQQAEAGQIELERAKAETRKIYVESGILTPQAVQQQMLDDGEISQEVYDSLQLGPDLTTDVVADDTEQEGNSPNRTNAAAREQDKAAKADEASNYADTERLAWEAEMTTAMNRALRETMQDAGDRIVAQSKGFTLFRTKDDVTARELPNDPAFWEEFRVRMVRTMLPFSRDIANSAASYAGSLGIDVDMDLVNEQVLDFSRSYTNAWWQEIDAATRRGMRSAITTWQETGLGEQGLPDLVKSLETLFDRARAERIAVTEVTRLFNEGSKLAYASAGLEGVQFQTVRDELVCPTCSPLDGQIFKLSEAPTPPLHVRCRCALLGVANNRAIGGRS